MNISFNKYAILGLILLSFFSCGGGSITGGNDSKTGDSDDQAEPLPDLPRDFRFLSPEFDVVVANDKKHRAFISQGGDLTFCVQYDNPIDYHLDIATWVASVSMELYNIDHITFEPIGDPIDDLFADAYKPNYQYTINSYLPNNPEINDTITQAGYCATFEDMQRFGDEVYLIKFITKEAVGNVYNADGTLTGQTAVKPRQEIWVYFLIA